MVDAVKWSFCEAGCLSGLFVSRRHVCSCWWNFTNIFYWNFFFFFAVLLFRYFLVGLLGNRGVSEMSIIGRSVDCH